MPKSFLARILTLFWVLIHITHCLPTENEDIRSKIITKHNFWQHQRQRKSGSFFPRVPKPFTISTQLNVRDLTQNRRGRTWLDKDGATVIEGIRVPDDETDKVTWRNGRVINNVFVPNVVYASDGGRQAKEYSGGDDEFADNDQVALSNERLESRDYSYHAGATDTGRPVYYVVEEPGSLHADRSPYTYEPADSQTSISSQVADYTQNGVSIDKQQSSSDFIIKEQTYSMCPGCPTFSIPVPIPKVNLQGSASNAGSRPNFPASGFNNNPYNKNNMTILERIGNSFKNTMETFQHTAMRFFNPKLGEDEDTISEKKDQFVAASESIVDKAEEESGTSPLTMAGIAVAAVGGVALLSSAMTLSRLNGGRSFRSESNEFLLREVAKKNFEMFREFDWNYDCIMDEICRENHLTDEASLTPLGNLVRRTCVSWNPLSDIKRTNCEDQRNSYRRRNNHKFDR